MADQITEAQMAFLKICRWGDSESVKEALLKGDVDPHAKEEQFDGRSALHLAADVGCRGVVQLLLEVGGVDVNVADDWMDWNPMVWAAKHFVWTLSSSSWTILTLIPMWQTWLPEPPSCCSC